MRQRRGFWSTGPTGPTFSQENYQRNKPISLEVGPEVGPTCWVVAEKAHGHGRKTRPYLLPRGRARGRATRRRRHHDKGEGMARHNTTTRERAWQGITTSHTFDPSKGADTVSRVALHRPTWEGVQPATVHRVQVDHVVRWTRHRPVHGLRSDALRVPTGPVAAPTVGGSVERRPSRHSQRIVENADEQGAMPPPPRAVRVMCFSRYALAPVCSMCYDPASLAA